MTVKELIEHLKTLPPDALVLRHDNIGWNERQSYQMPTVAHYKMVRCYLKRCTEFSEYKDAVQGIEL